MRFCPPPDAKGRALALVVLSILLSATPEWPASAQVVYCTNCSSELTQLQNYLQLVATLAKQAALLEQSITQTGLMVQNITPLAKPQYGNGQADLLALQNLVAQTNALSYASANLDTAGNARFQTYQTYAASPPTSSGFAAKYQQWSQDMEASVLTTLKAAQSQASTINGSEQQTVSQLKAQSSAAAGQIQRSKPAMPSALKRSDKSRSYGSFCSQGHNPRGGARRAPSLALPILTLMFAVASVSNLAFDDRLKPMTAVHTRDDPNPYLAA